ncbi:MAG: cytochrome b/b6 domain-containing protein [Arenicellales bacterium]
MDNVSIEYGVISRLIHGVIAALMVFLIWLGWWMVGLGYYDPYALASLQWHKALGLLLGLMVVFKLLWQVFHPVSASSLALNPLEKFGAKLMHFALLLLMVLLPITGYIISTAKGAEIELLSGWAFPALFPISEGVNTLATEVHYYVAYGAVILIFIHAMAALKHHFYDR